VLVDIASTSLSEAIAHNISIWNENILEVESENLKLKDRLNSLREEMKKKRRWVII
jgi:hypothetical protein